MQNYVWASWYHIPERACQTYICYSAAVWVHTFSISRCFKGKYSLTWWFSRKQVFFSLFLFSWSPFILANCAGVIGNISHWMAYLLDVKQISQQHLIFIFWIIRVQKTLICSFSAGRAGGVGGILYYLVRNSV